MELLVESPPVEVSAREKHITRLYVDAMPAVAAFVRKMNGSFQDAKDIFQDAMVLYLEQLARRELVISGTPERYVLGIAKHLWLQKFKHDRKHVSIDEVASADTIPYDFYPTVNEVRLLRVLEKAGKKCLDLLHVFYYESLPMTKIASLLGYRNAHTATVQKYKCMEKVRTVIKEKLTTYDDFYE